MISVAEFIYFIKKVVSSAYAVYRKLWLNILKPSILLFVLIKVKTISRIKMKRYAEIGLPCRVRLSSLKERVLFSSFKTYDSWFLSNVLIHFINSSPKPYCFRTVNCH